MIDYTCKNCGAKMTYDPKLGKLYCEYCRHTEEVTEEIKEETKNETEVKTEKGLRANSDQKYICTSCGAELEVSEICSSTVCVYCNAGVVLTDRLQGNKKPERIIPFKIKREAAESIYKAWCRKNKFLPAILTAAQTIKGLEGIYIPFWLFNTKSNVDTSGEGVIIRKYRSGDTEYTEKSYYHFRRDIDVNIKDMPCTGSYQIDEKLLSGLEPYHLKDAEVFNEPYLAGFNSDQYERSNIEAKQLVLDEAQRPLENLYKTTTSQYNLITYANSDVKHYNVDHHYTLLPVWKIKYSYNGEDKMFLINGQTGALSGSAPVDKNKAIKSGVILSIILIPIVSFIGLFFI